VDSAEAIAERDMFKTVLLRKCVRKLSMASKQHILRLIDAGGEVRRAPLVGVENLIQLDCLAKIDLLLLLLGEQA
jgi:hypothetical protein